MRMFVALLLTALAVVIRDCRGEDNSHCPLPAPPVCPEAPIFYKINGQCNNKDNKHAGSEASPYSRYLTRLQMRGGPNYVTLFNKPLASPREVSRKLFPCHDGSVSDATHLFAMFAKLIMFDMFHTERSSTEEDCSSGKYGINTNAVDDPRNPSCPCIKYKTPIRIKNIKCTGSDTEGQNKVTHALDMSFMYSPVHYSGTLNEDGKFTLNGEELLAISGDQFSEVADPIRKSPLLMALYHIVIREYNRLVDKLTPTCGSNAAAEAKKLMIAIYQHIIYKEFLPMLLGADAPVIVPYSPETMPVIFNSFTIAYQTILVSMLRKTVSIGNQNVEVNDIPRDTTKVDSNAEMTDLVKGMLHDCSLKIGRKMPCLSNDACTYPDMVSILTQDMRYLGIPSYFIWLTLTVPMVDIPVDMNTLPHHDSATKTVLGTVYEKIYDIDFLSGALTETKAASKKLGPTLLKLFGDQFSTLQKGDRFYYEHTGVFSADQLVEIRKMTMAHLLCRNVNGLTEVKSEAFKCASPEVACSTLEDIDFCKYCGVAGTWTEYVSTPEEECQLFKIEFRTCESTKPDACPCLGSPFKISSCPGDIITLETELRLRLLVKMLDNDKDAKFYYNNRSYIMLKIRAMELYEKMIS